VRRLGGPGPVAAGAAAGRQRTQAGDQQAGDEERGGGRDEQ
jgi:hypothetical protein